MFDCVVGIDVSKSSFDAAIINSKSNLIKHPKFEMNSSGLTSILQSIQAKSRGETLVVMESTGIYHRNLTDFFLRNSISVAVVNPMLIHNFTKSVTTRKTKTDAIDATIIARYGMIHYDRINPVKKPLEVDLKDLNREREYVTQCIAKEKTKVKQSLSVLFPELERYCNVFTKSMLSLLVKYPSAQAITLAGIKKLAVFLSTTSKNKSKIDVSAIFELAKNSIGSGNANLEIVLKKIIERINMLTEQQQDLDDTINEAIDEKTEQMIDILTSIKGIGKLIARNFLIEIGNFDKFLSAKKIIGFSGTDPATKQSGTSNIRGGISKRGSPFLRRTLWQMAVNVILYEQKFKDYYNLKKSAGKAYKQAVIAVGNKLINTMFAMLKHQKVYNGGIAMSMNK